MKQTGTKKNKLKALLVFYQLIDQLFNDIQFEILSHAECAVEGKDRWKALRARVLSICNDKKRHFKEELKRNWDLEYDHIPPVVGQDVIEIVHNPVQEKEKENDTSRPNEEKDT